eukprot:2395846-Amphidinium_carterae.1
MRRSMQPYLLATTSAPTPVLMDLGCIPWSIKGKCKDGKSKGHKGDRDISLAIWETRPLPNLYRHDLYKPRNTPN